MADSKPVKQEVNGTVTLPPLVIPGLAFVYTVTIHIKTLPITTLPITDATYKWLYF
jgi:hypothetical protein